MATCSIRSAAVLVSLALSLAACGDAGDGGKGSASAPVRSAGLTPNSLKTASAAAKPSATTPPPAASSAGPTELAKTNCPETEKDKRACTAAEFQKAWQAAKDPSTHPSSASYKISGKVTKVETSDATKGQTGDTRVYLKGDTKDVGFIFKAKSKDIDAASKLAVGADATFVCRFGGLEEMSVVTLDDCTM